ncbi:MAG TPA: SCO family protein [Candidatus Krumholzibacteria bacterium]|nr:SCO family protein [Candidatus Krumholzibacteria bacterium]
MRRHAVSIGLAMLIAGAAGAQAPDESKTVGTQMPDVELIADNDSTFRLSSLWGKPVIVSPIFTTCPHTCTMITESLRDALRGVGAPGVGYHVVTVSFDPADDSAAMRAYRERMQLPPSWRLATARPDQLAALLTALDFTVTPMAEGGFAHPNLVVVLGPDLRVARYVHGVMFEAADLRTALEDASTQASLVRRFRPYIVLVSVMAVGAVVWVLLATRKRAPSAG